MSAFRNWILWNKPLYTVLCWIAWPLSWPARLIAELRFKQIFPDAPEAASAPTTPIVGTPAASDTGRLGLASPQQPEAATCAPTAKRRDFQT